jgi:predicted Zn finger-like uncharacterized protein
MGTHYQPGSMGGGRPGLADVPTGPTMPPATLPAGEPEGLATTTPPVEGFATCPSCHTSDAAVTNAAVGAGADWRCRRCGQRWDGRRLAAVAAYAKWDVDYRAASMNRAAII